MSDQRKAKKNVRLTEPAWERLHEHCRDGETLSAAVLRMADALERERELPDAVAEVLREE